MAVASGVERAWTVVVVGGGFSGLLTAVHLLRRHPSVRIFLVEQRARLGEGRAYGDASPDHLLNVRAANMSAFPDEPDHFLRWLGPGVAGDAYVSRNRYAGYLRHVLAQTVASSGAPRLEHVRGRAERARPEDSRWRVDIAGAPALHADAMVLAIGFLAPAWPKGVNADRAGGPAFIMDPWSADLRAAPEGEILLLGSGLTMVDVALSLTHSNRRIVALSRRGLSPLAHGPAVSKAPPGEPASMPLAMLRSLRRYAGEIGWRSAVDSVRPLTMDIWRGWSSASKSQFLRHLQPWWDIHRHRMAPQVERSFGALLTGGALSIEAGKLLSLKGLNSGGAEAEIRFRGQEKPARRRFDAVVNCTTPLGDPCIPSSGLIADLRNQGRLRADRMGLGVEVDDQSRLIGADGRPTTGLYAVGPLTRGAFWEAVAVPDLRLLTARTARAVLTDLDEYQHRTPGRWPAA